MRVMLMIAATAALSGAATAQNAMAPVPSTPIVTQAPTPPLVTRPGLAANRGAMMQACQADFKSLCPGMTPGDGKLGPCIRANQSKLSPVCASAMQARLGNGRMMPPPPPSVAPAP
ncbi:hypothetical protein [Sphingomonas sp. 28-62-11]|uniref:hypothetical protein n=1 Tax=Sphingomonas sp. 28-62-11 TaxID=1970432 RepID=UPI0035A93056